MKNCPDSLRSGSHTRGQKHTCGITCFAQTYLRIAPSFATTLKAKSAFTVPGMHISQHRMVA